MNEIVIVLHILENIDCFYDTSILCSKTHNCKIEMYLNSSLEQVQ